MDLKDKISSAQAVVSIVAIIVGAWWTYDTFIRERRHLPHANIEHKVSHVRLDPKTTLLQVAVTVSNTGSSYMEIKTTDVRIQQVLPIVCVNNDPRCAKQEIAESLIKSERSNDIFSWPLISRRRETNRKSVLEPGETERLDFEFPIRTDVRAVRIYSYIRNERLQPNIESGWHMSSYYELPAVSGGK